jgi:hypothetical protein
MSKLLLSFNINFYLNDGSSDTEKFIGQVQNTFKNETKI